MKPKVVILAGGYGTRLAEETSIKPKPMVEIGGMPILWHIMKLYYHQGFSDFVILLGHMGYYIKEYFAHYYLYRSDITINTVSNDLKIHNNKSEEWTITLVDTGIDTMTGSRIKLAQKYIGQNRFMLTYGDGLCCVDLNRLLEFHLFNKKLMTLTAILPVGRFGVLDFEDEGGVNVKNFVEKPKGNGQWISGGFFVCEPEMLDYIDGDDNQIFLEREPLQKLAQNKQLVAMKYKGFWKCMDTLRDKQQLCQMWNQGEAPWKIW